jgi:branched-chain amino acid transport system permease protein
VCWALAALTPVGGWPPLAAAVLVAVALRGRAAARETAPTDVPPEWWGVRRPWRPEDGEALDRATAAAG